MMITRSPSNQYFARAELSILNILSPCVNAWSELYSIKLTLLFDENGLAFSLSPSMSEIIMTASFTFDHVVKDQSPDLR